MKAILPAVAVLAVLAFLTPVAIAGDAGVKIRIVTEYDEVTAGDSLRAAAVVSNPTNVGHFVIVKAFLSPVAEPIPVPPVTRWEAFVWELLAELTGDTDVLYVPAGETRTAVLTLDVHPRMHGRFDVVGSARTELGVVEARTKLISKITSPPANGGVLVHGRLYEIGACRLLVTDDGHIYEPKGPLANRMFALLDTIYPRPDGVTVLGGILPNTIGCFGVELRTDLFRFDHEPDGPVGLRWHHLARGSNRRPYVGPNTEIVRNPRRFKWVVDQLDALLVGDRPDFRKEMVAVVTTRGTSLTRIRVGRTYIQNGVLQVHYTVVNPGPGCLLPAVFGQPYHLVALPLFRGPVRFVRHDVKIRCDAVRTGVATIDRALDLSNARVLNAATTTTEKLSPR
jgi:hypothetical protein